MALDCVTKHRVFVYDRGGVNRIDEITKLARVKWGRVRDDISQAEVDISAASCDAQSGLLGGLEPGRHELVVYRDDKRVWEGPLTRMTYARTGIQMYAKDVMFG